MEVIIKLKSQVVIGVADDIQLYYLLILMRPEILIHCIFLHRWICIKWSKMKPIKQSRRKPSSKYSVLTGGPPSWAWILSASPRPRARFLTPSPTGRRTLLLSPLPRSISKCIPLPHQRGERQSGAPHGHCAQQEGECLLSIAGWRGVARSAWPRAFLLFMICSRATRRRRHAMDW
jgi:hypothetical protein